MSQCIVFCRTNLDCTNLEAFLNTHYNSGKKFLGGQESGKESKYSCCVLAGEGLTLLYHHHHSPIDE